MAKAGTVYVEVEAETTRFRKQLEAAAAKGGTAAGKTVGDNVSKGLGSSKKSIDSFNKTMQGAQQAFVGIGIAAGVLGTVGVGLKSAADAASRLNEQVSGAKQTFGAAAGEVRGFAKGTATAIGVSAAAALKASNMYGAFFKQAGFAQQAAAKYSTTLVQLAGDLASFKDVSVDQALEAISSGLAGESEPLRRLGVDLRMTKVDAEAMALGLARTTAELTETDRVAARYSSLLRQTSDAQTDAARTANEYANTQRRFNATMEDFKANAGQSVLPMLTRLTQGASVFFATLNRGREGMKAFGVSMGEVGKAIGIASLAGAGSGGLGTLPVLFNELGKAASDNKDAMRKAAEAYQNAFTKFGAGSATAKDAAAAFRDEVQKAEDQARKTAEGLESTAQAAARLRGEMLTATTAVQGYIASQRSVKDAQNAVRDAQRGVEDAERRLNDLRSRGAVDAQKVADAERNLESASRGVASARRALIDAEKEVARLRKGPSADEAGDAARAVARADIDLTRARNRLAELRKERPTKDRTRAEIALDLKSAELDVADAIDRQAGARRDQIELQQRGKEGSEQLTTALEREKDAHDNLNEQLATQKRLSEELRDARVGDPDFASDLASAESGLADQRERLLRVQQDLPGVIDAARIAQQNFTADLLASTQQADALRAALERLGYPVLPGAPKPGQAVAPPWDPNAMGPPPLRPSLDVPYYLQRRANSGPVTGGTPYVVGEKGPEVYRPQGSGRIEQLPTSSTVAVHVNAPIDTNTAAQIEMGARVAQWRLGSSGRP